MGLRFHRNCDLVINLLLISVVGEFGEVHRGVLTLPNGGSEIVAVKLLKVNLLEQNK